MSKEGEKVNRYLEKLVDSLDSDVAEVVFAVSEVALTLTGTVGGIIMVLSSPWTWWTWIAILLSGYFGIKALENLLWVGLEEDIPFGEEIYHDEDD